MKNKKILCGCFILLYFSCTRILGQDNFVEDSLKYGQGKVWKKPDVPASFPGGRERMKEFFKLKFDFHADGDLLEGAKEGTVKAKFIIETNGKVKYVFITKHYTNAYDEEMVNTLMCMPKWEPAMVEGKPVRSFESYSVSINFFMK